jgi:pimeloyl-ACP methyl ester carboxylesterase
MAAAALAFQQAFPDRTVTLVLVNAPTPELAREARDAPLNVLLPKHEFFRSVRAPDGGAFFEQDFLLYLSTEELAPEKLPLIRAFTSWKSTRACSPSAPGDSSVSPPPGCDLQLPTRRLDRRSDNRKRACEPRHR